jgi:hypothetical protein
MTTSFTPTLAACALTLAFTSSAQAFNPQPDPPGKWAMLGLVAEQTARVTVLAVPVGRGTMRQSCTVTINFINADGVQMIEASTFVLLPGKAQFVDLKGSNLRLAERSDRAQFRTGIDVLHNPPSDLPCGGVAATVEIFDANGHTSAVIAHPVQF